MAQETKFNIVQAADLAGVTRQTIHRFIQKGKLSVEQTADGKTVIDKSELLRVFPNLVTPGASQRLHPDTLQVTALLHAQIELLQRELEVTRQKRERDREEYRREKDRLLGIIEKQTLLLPAPTAPDEKKGWFRRLLT